MGRYVRRQRLHGLLVGSARCGGVDAAILGPERLSGVRGRAFLTFRLNARRDKFVAHRMPGRKWITFAPRSLG